MLHLVFYARIASETNDFNITDVLNSICDKLVNRHPHIYSGCGRCSDENDVKRNWEQIKLKEGNKSVWVACTRFITRAGKSIAHTGKSTRRRL